MIPTKRIFKFFGLFLAVYIGLMVIFSLLGLRGVYMNMFAGFGEGWYNTFGNKEAKGNDQLLKKKTSYAKVLELANPSQRRVLEGLSEHLGLEGDDRYTKAEARSAEIEKKRAALLKQFNEGKKTFEGHRNAIRNELYGKWPELSNLLTEESVRLVSEGSEEFVGAVKGHERFKGWNQVEKERKKLASFMSTARR